MARQLDASVVIPTHNRAPLLDRVLASFAEQTADSSVFEVIVVDDGSTDETPTVHEKYVQRLNVRYVPIAKAGSAAAKNIGIGEARGGIVVLAEDDDTADPRLVAEHLEVHRKNAGKVAGLGYATWDPAVRVTDLLHFVTDVGRFLSAYPGLRDGEVLDFHHFWSGRISLERELLLASGGFSEQMVALEDVELGYRLEAMGLRIVFAPRAVNYMLRAFDFDGFCERCERTGRGLACFRLLQPVVGEEYETMLLGRRAQELQAARGGTATTEALAVSAADELAEMRAEVLRHEARLQGKRRVPPTSPFARLSPTRRRLYRLYDESFRTAILKGAVASDADR
jgi:glycosyltransferase involved in cell wall biosynthesis